MVIVRTTNGFLLEHLSEEEAAKIVDGGEGTYLEGGPVKVAVKEEIIITKEEKPKKKINSFKSKK